MKPLSYALIPALILVSGCHSGGATSGGLQNAISEDTATYAILELSTGNISWHLNLPFGSADPTLRTTCMAFRRVPTGGTTALVGVFEVTQAQWQTLYGTPAPTTWPWEDVEDEICDSATAHGPTRPAYNLQAELVQAVLDGYTPPGRGRLTLPTDAQWTAACGTASGWSWGANTTQAQVEANAVVREGVLDTSRLDANGIDVAGPLAIGSRAANSLGIFDIHGNVWELISGGDHARGGSWRDSVWQSRSEVSLGDPQNFHAELDYALVGVRLVLLP